MPSAINSTGNDSSRQKICIAVFQKGILISRFSLLSFYTTVYSASGLLRRQKAHASARVNSKYRTLSPPRISSCNREIFPARNACHNGCA